MSCKPQHSCGLNIFNDGIKSKFLCSDYVGNQEKFPVQKFISFEFPNGTAILQPTRSAIGLFVTRCYNGKMQKQNTSTKLPSPTRDATAVFDKPITIVGLMGSGKSVIGRHLAKQLDLPFADSDQLVKKMAGVSIADIFDLAGEAKFREMEFRAIKKQLGQPPHVLATGGGAFCEPETATLLYENTIVVWLQASSDTLLKRIGDTTSRPLLQTGPPLEILQQLQTARAPFYRKAHIHLNTDGLTVPKSLTKLVSALDSFQAKQ